MLRLLWDLFLFFVPRFITEEVAVSRCPDGTYELECAMHALEDGERYDGVVDLDVFVFMHFCVVKQGPRAMEVKPWP
ncbi:MAG: hypothetical protein WC322_06005 [Candidatus Paceibacterota bacterium]|jgi:hypothetical protein